MSSVDERSERKTDSDAAFKEEINDKGTSQIAVMLRDKLFCDGGI